MTLAKAMTLALLVASVAGCASQIQPVTTFPVAAEKPGEEQSQKSALPSFTYRPGG